MRRRVAALAAVVGFVLWSVLASFPGSPASLLHAAPVPPRFQDVTALVGVNAVAIDPKNPAESGDWGVIAVADYDGDGWDDVLLNTHPGFKLYRNQGNGTFAQAPFVLPAVVTNYNDHRHLLLWCDVDTDGDDDLIIGTGFDSPTRVNLWMRNNGNGTFSDVTQALRVEDPGSNDWAVTCADLDRNGWPDVLFARNSMPSLSSDLPVERLWMNYAMQFREEAAARGFSNRTRAKRAYALQFADVSGDGYPEGAGVGNNYNSWFLARGDGTYRLASGTYEPLADFSPYLHDVDWADFNGDGLLDAAIVDTFTSKSANNALVAIACGNSTYSWTPGSADGWRWCWTAPNSLSVGQDPRAVAIGDFDNDGDVDMFVTHNEGMEIDGTGAKGPDWFFLNAGNAQFTEMAKTVGLQGPVGSRYGGGGAAVLDYDQDGRLDLVVGYNALYYPGPFKVYRNVSAAQSWVGFRLKAPLILGAVVRVEACGRRQVSQVNARTGWLSQDSRVVHFGLAGCQESVAATVLWPDGRQSQLTVNPNAYYVVSSAGSQPGPAPAPTPTPTPTPAPTPSPGPHSGTTSSATTSPSTTSSSSSSSSSHATSGRSSPAPRSGASISGAAAGAAQQAAPPLAVSFATLTAGTPVRLPQGRRMTVVIGISGGTAPYTMQISSSRSGTICRSTGGTSTAACSWNMTGVSPGRYTLTADVRDAAGQQARRVVQITIVR